MLANDAVAEKNISFFNAPKPEYTYREAAEKFYDSKQDFLKGNPPKGSWYITCFPVRGYVQERLTWGKAWRMMDTVKILCSYESNTREQTIKDLEVAFKVYFEYPPYSLDDDWDGKAYERRTRAEEIYRVEHSG